MSINEKLQLEKKKFEDQAEKFNRISQNSNLGVEAIVLPCNWRVYYKLKNGDLVDTFNKKI